MSLHNFNSNTKSWKMYTNILTSISGDDLLVAPSYGKDLILEVSANNDIFFKKGDITKGFGNIVSDYLDVSFVREASFNSLNSQMQYVLQEISGISNDLLDTSYNIILSGGVFIQNNEYASYDILDITGKIIFTDNSTNVQRINDVSLNNVDICGSLNVAGTISAPNIYTKTEIDASFSNVYTKLDVLDSSLANVITYVDASFSNVYTRGQIDVSFVVKELLDISLSNVYTKLDVLDLSLVNVITYVDASFSNVYTKLDVLDVSLANVITYVDASFSNVYTKLDALDVSLANVITYVDASFTNVYTKLDALDVSLANVITYVDASFSNVYSKLDVLDNSFTNVYTKSLVYTKSEVDNSFTNVYTKSLVYTKAEVDVSFVSKELFDASLNSIQLSNVYTKAEVDVSFVSKELFDASLSGILLDGIFIQNNEYASYDILDITGKIIFTDNSTNIQRINDVSLNNVDISGSLNVAGTISAPNIYTKTEIDASLANIYTNSLDVSGNVTIGGSTLYVPSLFTIDPNGHGDNTGTLLINGNLVVQGVTTTINSSVVDISDKILVLASNASNSLQADGAGFEISGAKVNMLYNNSSNTFRTSIGMSISGNVVPTTNSVGSLGESDKIWDIAYIRELNVTNFTNSIDGSKIASGTISSTQIENGSILTVDISDHAITYEKIAANAVTNTRIANGAVTHAKLSSDCIQSHNIVDGTIMDVDISDNAAISGSKIANASITSDKINQSNNWTFSQLTSTSANIRDISTTNIEVSGNIVPLHDLSSNLGSSLKRWRNIFANDLSVNNINGQAYIGGGYTKIEIDVSFVSKELFDASLSSIQLSNVYTKAEVDVSFVSKELFDASLNGILSDGVFIQNNDYASYDILSITDTIIFTDNSNNEINNDVSFNNVDISGALNVAGTISAPNIYTKTEIDNSFTNVYTKNQVYNKTEIDISFVSKELFDASINALAVSGGGGGSSSTPYDNNIKILPDWVPLLDISSSIYRGPYGTGQYYGRTIAFSKDGTTIAATVDGHTVNGNEFAGKVIVYQINGTTWVQKGQELDGARTQAYFGTRIALSNNGNIIASGASYGLNGVNNYRGYVQVFAYNLTTSLWVQLGSTIISGLNYGISFNLVAQAVGAGVALSGDGTILAVGAPETDNYCGAAIIFKYETKNSVLDWHVMNNGSLFYIPSIDGTIDFNPTTYDWSGEYFGYYVTLSSDGNVVAVLSLYAPAENYYNTFHSINTFYTGVVRTFKWNGTSWIQTGRIFGEHRDDTGHIGNTLSLSANGNYLAYGAFYNSDNGLWSGHARVFYWNDNSWNKLGEDIDGQGFTPNTNQLKTGISVSLSNDGTILAVTAKPEQYYYGTFPKLGRVYKWDGVAWNILGGPFAHGTYAMLSGDGNKLAVGNGEQASNGELNTITIYNLVQNKIVSLNSTNLFFSDGYSYSYKKKDVHRLSVFTNESSVHTEFYSDFPNKFSRILYIAQNGDLFNWNNTYGSFSDIRLKENIVDATPKLQDLLKVRVVNYNLKGSPNKCIGVIAQELEEIFPSLISEEGEREKYKSVKYSCMNIMLVKALQEQQVLINDMSSNISTLKDEVATLKQGINSLAARLEALEQNNI